MLAGTCALFPLLALLGDPFAGYGHEAALTGPLYFRGWSEPERREVRRALPEVLSHVERRLGRTLGESFTTALTADGFEFRRLVEELSGEPLESDAVVGVALPSRRTLVLRGGMPPGSTSYRQTLAHEVAHLVIHGASAGPIPRWLDEGAATWVAGERLTAREEGFLALLARTGGLYGLSQLERRFPGGHRATSVAYQQSALFITYLSERHGEAVVAELLDRGGHGGRTREVVEAVAGESLEAVEREFSGWVAARASLAVSLLALVSPWSLCALLALVAIARSLVRRRQRLRTLEDGDGDGDGDEEGAGESPRSPPRSPPRGPAGPELPRDAVLP
jgi:hypothetical protein